MKVPNFETGIKMTVQKNYITVISLGMKLPNPLQQSYNKPRRGAKPIRNRDMEIPGTGVEARQIEAIVLKHERHAGICDPACLYMYIEAVE